LAAVPERGINRPIGIEPADDKSSIQRRFADEPTDDD
jgi:hypothetical protein